MQKIEWCTQNSKWSKYFGCAHGPTGFIIITIECDQLHNGFNCSLLNGIGAKSRHPLKSEFTMIEPFIYYKLQTAVAIFDLIIVVDQDDYYFY